MSILITTFLSLFLFPFGLPEGTQNPVAPPVLPAREVKLVPPPLPAGLVPAPAAGQELQAEYRDGVVRFKIGDTWLPVMGGCCFCPDGAEKPLKWEPAKSSKATTEKR